MSGTLTRPRVACINWNGDDWQPRAGVLVPLRDGRVESAYFETWTEAMAWANRYARLWAERRETCTYHGGCSNPAEDDDGRCWYHAKPRRWQG